MLFLLSLFFLFKKDVGVDDIIWYNASAGGYYSIASSNKGLYYLTTKQNPEMITRKETKRLDSISSNQKIYFLGEILPSDIERIYTMYAAAFIFLKKEEPFIVSLGDFKNYSVFDDLFNFVSKENLILPLSGNGRNFLNWSKENHVNYPQTFRRKVFVLFLVFQFLNKKNFFNNLKFPKVLIFEIVKIFSNFEF